MHLIIAFSAVLAIALAATPESCDPSKCQLPNCRCSGTDIPGGLSNKDVPQLVYFTFDDAVTAINFNNYEKAFFGRKNPDGCPMSATFFLSHEYADYSKVHELHARGHEIALHSISHMSSTDYWRNLPLETYVKEFGGEMEIISRFAKIDKSDLKGIRVPLLQLAGDTSFKAIKELGLTYDCTWPTRQFIAPGLWPYTLDYQSTQDCPIGPCPNIALPGVWVSPMGMWFDDKGGACSMVDACTNIPNDVNGIFEFMKRNFLKNYEGNRSPFGVYMHAAWFGQRENAFQAFLKFIDYIQSLNDVYAVSVSRGLEWVRNPHSKYDLKNVWPKCQKTYEPNCSPSTCKLMKEGQEERWMTICGNCPNSYPWLDNPLGQ